MSLRTLIRRLVSFSNKISLALTEKNMDFPEMFEDYEKYHTNVSTGKALRFELIKDWVEPNSTILDIGVGDGLMSEMFKKNKNATVSGLDISNIACKKAMERGIPVIVKDINQGLNFKPDEYYDYILLIEVIEHTIYPQKVLLEALSHSRKGVIVTIPNSAYIKWRIQLMRGFSPRQSFTHLHYWSINDFKLFCRKLDIEILDSKFSVPPW
ncbi:MAG: methyltransferase domain-containing protein, partial [Nitrosopumilus sp.]|nr:methyltransferase domain-containing protein [Nitrosopumilus sp.]